MRPRASHDDQPKIVADEVRQGVVGQHSRKVLEDFRRRRIVDVRFDLVATLVAHFAHQGVQKTEQIEVVTLLRNGNR